MIAITDFWKSNDYNHPDLTDEMINTAEAKLKVKLPDSLIALLKIMNGGYTKGFAFPMNVSTSWAENHIPLDTLNGIVTESYIAQSYKTEKIAGKISGNTKLNIFLKISYKWK